MIIIPIERLGAVNRQPDLSNSIKWINELLSLGTTVEQLSRSVEIASKRFPEGHMFPAGTFLIRDDTVVVPNSIYVDRTKNTDELLQNSKPLKVQLRIGIYNGLNCAPFCFDPYHQLFESYGFTYTELDDNDIRNGKLDNCDVLVVPGGPDAGESYYAGLGKTGMQNVEEFVAKGGGYLGSCAGSYLPLRALSGSLTERMWIGMVTETDKSGLDYWRTGTGFVRVSLSTSIQSEVLYGLSYGNPSTTDVIYWEGPVFDDIGDNTQVLVTYRELIGSGTHYPSWEPTDNTSATDALKWTNPLNQERFDTYLKDRPAAIDTTYGNGRLILFSFHPEFGNPTLPWKSNPVHLFIINALYSLSS